MNFEELKKLYLEKKEKYGAETYKYISELLKEAKNIHKKDWLNSPT
jgi:type II restriction enzyme